MNACEVKAIGPGQVNLLERLFELAADNLSDVDLRHIACLVEDATLLTGYLATVTEDIGCIVSDDENSGQLSDPHRLSNLMFMFSNVASQAEALLVVSTAARDLREQRQEAGRLTAPAPQCVRRKGAASQSEG